MLAIAFCIFAQANGALPEKDSPAPSVVVREDPVVPGGAWAVIGMIAGYLFSWLKDRDKLKFDQKQTQQEAKIVTLTAAVSALTDESAACEERAKRLEEKLDSKIWELKRKDESDKEELKAEIQQVRDSKGDKQ